MLDSQKSMDVPGSIKDTRATPIEKNIDKVSQRVLHMDHGKDMATHLNSRDQSEKKPTTSG